MDDLVKGLYYLSIIQASHQVSLQSNTNTWQVQQTFSFIPQTTLYHFRLGHPSNRKLLSLHKHIHLVTINKDATFDICNYAKHSKTLFQLSVNKANQSYEFIYFDIWGPLSIQSIHRHKYFITALDGFSRFTCVILKSQTMFKAL